MSDQPAFCCLAIAALIVAIWLGFQILGFVLKL